MSVVTPIKSADVFGSALAADEDVTVLFGRIAPALSRLQAIPLQLAEYVMAIRVRIAENHAASEISETERARRESEIRAAAVAYLDQVMASAQQDVRFIEMAIEKAAHPAPAGDTTAQLLREQQLARTWQRIVYRLDPLQDAGAVLRTIEDLAKAAAESGDDLTLTAFREDGPAYLAGRGFTGLASTVTDLIGRLEAPYVPAVVRAAGIIERRMDDGCPRVYAAINLARGDVSGQGSRVVVLPGFGTYERFTLN